ncbi:hypothetical protein V8E51_014688 [Hyaloscypha variabilis]
MGDSTKDLYTCDSCSSAIPTDRARVSCHSCANYHLCTNCFVIKEFSTPHLESHSTMVFKVSGFVVPPPPGFNRRPSPPLPPRTNSTTSTKQPNRLVDLASKNQGSDLTLITEPPQDSFETIPRQQLERIDSTAPSYPRPTNWEPLLSPSGVPTPIFVAFMSTVFSHLDPLHTGYLTPEVYAGFLDVQGCLLSGNVWKSAQQKEKEKVKASLDVADLELGRYFLDHGIPHTLASRHKHKHKSSSLSLSPQKPLSAVEERIKESLRFRANMPLLTRQGFIDLARREYLANPEARWVCVKRLRVDYGIWNELEEIPRSVLPAGVGNELVGEKEEDRPALPTRINSESCVKVNGGEKKVEVLLKGDEWQHETPRSVEHLVEVTDAVQNVNILLQNDEVMRAEGEREREKKGRV